MKVNLKFKLLSSLLMLVFYGTISSLTAQSDPSGERRVTGTYAITNATITTSPGKLIEGATILIKDGLIQQIGTSIKLPVEAQVIPGDSLFIYPGFIDGASKAGVSKPKDPERPSDFNPSNPPDEIAGITPWRAVLDNFDSKSSHLADWRKTGFTIGQLVPEGGMIPGKAAIVVYGNNYSTNIIAQNTGLYAKFQGSRGMYPGTALGVMAKFRDLYKNAELSSQHGRLFASNVGLNRPEINKTLEALYPVLDQNIPIFFEVSDELEIRRALSLQKELGFKLVLVGVTQVEHVIEEIKESGTQVLLSLNLPDDKASKKKKEDVSEDSKERIDRVIAAYNNALTQPSILEKAGVPFGFTSSGSKSGDVMKNLRLMIENGLSEAGALSALTSNNASILGIQKFAGTLEKGKLANMVITTAPIFEENTAIKHVIADGYIFDFEIKPKKTEKDSNGTEAVSIIGEWDYTSDTPDGSGSGTMVIEQSGDSYSGKITYEDPSGGGTASSEMKDIELSGNILEFAFDVTVGGSLYQVTVKGEIEDDTITGNLNLVDAGSFPFRATKKPNQSNL